MTSDAQREMEETRKTFDRIMADADLPSLHQKLADFLHEIGWVARNDAQWTNLRDAMPLIESMFVTPDTTNATRE